MRKKSAAICLNAVGSLLNRDTIHGHPVEDMCVEWDLVKVAGGTGPEDQVSFCAVFILSLLLFISHELSPSATPTLSSLDLSPIFFFFSIARVVRGGPSDFAFAVSHGFVSRKRINMCRECIYAGDDGKQVPFRQTGFVVGRFQVPRVITTSLLSNNIAILCVLYFYIIYFVFSFN